MSDMMDRETALQRAREHIFSMAVSDAAADLCAANLAFGRLGQPRQQPQQAGLAGTVFAAHMQPLARIHRQIQLGKQAPITAHAG